MEPRPITPKQNEPLNRLLFAINHYVSTGDHVGEGIALPTGREGDPSREQLVMIPVNTKMEQDREDFAAFGARLNELGWELEKMGRDGIFEFYALRIREDEMDALAEKLRERPGQEGWGSMKETIDKHFPDR